MALGAITATNINPAGGPVDFAGGWKVSVNDVVLDSSYPTNGSPLTAAQLGLNVVIFTIVSAKAIGANGPAGDSFYDIANSKLKSFGATGEISNTTNLSTSTATIVAFGY